MLEVLVQMRLFKFITLALRSPAPNTHLKRLISWGFSLVVEHHPACARPGFDLLHHKKKKKRLIICAHSHPNLTYTHNSSWWSRQKTMGTNTLTQREGI
jgi:hypothetical protein